MLLTRGCLPSLFKGESLRGRHICSHRLASSSSPSSSPFPERRSLRGHHIQPPPRPLLRCAEPLLERRKTRKQKMVWKSDQPCRFYMIDGSCKYGSDCWFSHGLDSFGRIEMQIRVLLHMTDRLPVPVVDLPGNCSELHAKLLQDGWNVNLDHLLSLLWRLHTIYLFHDSFQWYVILLEDAPPAYNPNVMDFNSEAHQIYITFSAQSREITEGNVCWYFRHYGPVLSVNIPHERSYGFVRFLYPETVRLLLSNWNPEVPHFILGARLHVNRYIPYYLRNPAVNHGPNDPDGGLEHMPNAPGGVAGQVLGVPDGNAAQYMNSAGNHGPNGPGGGLGHLPNAPGAVPDEVLGVLDGDAAEQDMNPVGNHVPNGPNGGPGHCQMPWVYCQDKCQVFRMKCRMCRLETQHNKIWTRSLPLFQMSTVSTRRPDLTSQWSK